ncbi:MAG: hypothetical protein IPJ13_15990 [Saprospiraceae bacterium]|nr:hypothetical protein [Saprospiraceae bacterium]
MIKKSIQNGKVSLVLEYRAQGMSFEDCLSITGITRNQFITSPKAISRVNHCQKDTKWRNPNTNQMEKVPNAKVVEDM